MKLTRQLKIASGARVDGLVTLQFDVDEAGFVINPEVLGNTGPDAYVNAALKTITRYRYAPAFEDGEPVMTKGLKINIRFDVSS